MFRIFLITLISINTIIAANVAPTSQIIRSYPINKNNIFISANLHTLNKDLDLFGIIDDNIGGASKHGTLGDLTALDILGGYGYNEYISIFYNSKISNIDYAGDTLTNNQQNIFLKLNIYNNSSSMMETFSTDIGLIHNGGNDITINGSNLRITKMSDMSDNSFYIRTLTGTKIMSSILDLYLGIKNTSINTKLDSISYNRNEFAVDTGFQYTVEAGNILIGTGYKYIKLFSRDIDADNNSNHIFNFDLSYAVSKNLLINTGIKYFSNQFTGEIPYLHNQKTVNESDRKFAYGTIGIVYNYNLDNLVKKLY